MPPTTPDPDKKGGFLFQLFRPEFVRTYSTNQSLPRIEDTPLLPLKEEKDTPANQNSKEAVEEQSGEAGYVYETEDSTDDEKHKEKKGKEERDSKNGEDDEKEKPTGYETEEEPSDTEDKKEVKQSDVTEKKEGGYNYEVEDEGQEKEKGKEKEKDKETEKGKEQPANTKKEKKKKESGPPKTPLCSDAFCGWGLAGKTEEDKKAFRANNDELRAATTFLISTRLNEFVSYVEREHVKLLHSMADGSQVLYFKFNGGIAEAEHPLKCRQWDIRNFVVCMHRHGYLSRFK